MTVLVFSGVLEILLASAKECHREHWSLFNPDLHWSPT